MPWLLRCWKFLNRWPRLQQWLLRLLNPAFLIGVVAVIFDDDGKVVLFHHSYRSRYPWGLPGGWLRRGEDPTDALAREVMEETSLKVRVIAPLAANSLHVAPNFEVIYLARLTGGEFRPSPEVDQIGHFNNENLPEIKQYQKEIILASFDAWETKKLPNRV